jgi:hypothetical protein
MAGYFIDQIFGLADDQIGSQYKLTFPAGFPAGVSSAMTPDDLTLRLDKNFEIPKQVAQTYEYYYQGIKVAKLGPKDETEKKFKLDFRLDQNWDVHAVFKSWYDLCYNPREGIAGPESSTRSTLKFTAVAGDATNLTKVDKKTYTFYKVKPISYGPSEFANDSGEPVRFEVEFIFLYYED